MLERKEYNKEMDKVRLNQVKEISEYLEKAITINSKIRDLPVNLVPDEELIEKLRNIPIPTKGRDPKEVGDELINDVFTHNMMIQHPRFLSLVASAVSPYSIAGGVLTEVFNPNAAGKDVAPGCAVIEEKLIKWMCSLAGFGEGCGGIFTSGGSLSNLTCMIAARENKLPGRYDLPNGVCFYSDQAHSSVIKGMRMMGLRDDQCIKIESDDEFKMDIEKLEIAIKEQLALGKKPFLMVGTVGTTNTGTIDPFDKMADLAQKYDMWLHVDGAYGGSILFSPIYKHLAKGIERADSLSWDTHKWSLQTYSCSCALAKDKQTFIQAFHEHPEYLADVSSAEHNDGWDLGIEMSRPCRFIKLWYTVQAMGTDLLADVIDYSFYNAKVGYERILSYPDWEIISKPSCGTFNFRYVPKDVSPEKYDDLNGAISKAVCNDGYAYVLNTTLKGKRVIRLCMICGNTEAEDVINTVDKINEFAVKIKEQFK